MPNSYYEFRNPAVPGTRIVSARYNQDMAAIAAGFDLLPDSGDLFLNLLGYGSASGSVPNVYNVTIPVGSPLTAYVTGMQVTFLADKTSTGAAQLNVNGLGNKLIVSSGTVGLPAGSIIAGSYYTLRFDGTNFQMQTALYALFDQAAASAASSAAAALTYRNDAQAAAVEASVSKSAAASSASSASSSATVATNQATAADNSAKASLGSANASSTSAGTAAARATDAATSASAALSYRNSAQTFANNAATSATNAANSATAAGNSATNAANSATAAANSASSIKLPLPVTSGGTGSGDAAQARDNLGLGSAAVRNTLTTTGDPVLSRSDYGIGVAREIGNFSDTTLLGFGRYTSSTVNRPDNNVGCGVQLAIDGSPTTSWLVWNSIGQAYIQRAHIQGGNYSWFKIYTEGNTTRASDGTLKAASPIIRIVKSEEENQRADIEEAGFAWCGSGTANEEAEGVKITRLDTGRYQVAGSLGLASEGWQMAAPRDPRGSGDLGIVEAEQAPDGNLVISLYKRRYRMGDDGDIYVVKGDLIDVPTNSWIDVRLDMPEAS